MSLIVTGAAGHLGRLVTEHLLERVAPEDLVLVTRRPEALRAFSARGVEVRYGDFDRPASLPEAFAGGRRMLLISTDAIGRRVRQHRAAIDAATRAGAGPGPAGANGVADPSRTSPTKRKPFRGTVRISFWPLPLSPIAIRAALIRLVRVESDTIRPCHTNAIRSSLLTTRSRFCSK